LNYLVLVLSLVVVQHFLQALESLVLVILKHVVTLQLVCDGHYEIQFIFVVKLFHTLN